VFSFLGSNFFDLSVGESALEPIQLAVRSVIERAVLEMVTRIYRAPGNACSIPLGTPDDPLREAGETPYNPPQVAYAAPYRQPNAPTVPHAPQPANYTPPPYQGNVGDGSRNNPYGGYGSGDPVGDVRLRGGL
jgi:curli production assembly/transport component CsgG/holdfast attachment protein HfaB